MTIIEERNWRRRSAPIDDVAVVGGRELRPVYGIGCCGSARCCLLNGSVGPPASGHVPCSAKSDVDVLVRMTCGYEANIPLKCTKCARLTLRSSGYSPMPGGVPPPAGFAYQGDCIGMACRLRCRRKNMFARHRSCARIHTGVCAWTNCGPEHVCDTPRRSIMVRAQFRGVQAATGKELRFAVT